MPARAWQDTSPPPASCRGRVGLPLFVLKVGQLDAAGHDGVDVLVPNMPSLIGANVHLQSVEDNQLGTHSAYLVSVVESFRIVL